MPPLDPDRTELLASIITEGDRRKHRRWVLGGAGGAAVVALLAVAALAWPGGGGDDTVATADDPTTTTASIGDTSTTTDTIETTTTTATIVVTTQTLPGEPPPTTHPPAGCRNSTDPACGDFYWDLPPGFVNQPISISAGAEPLQATAGQEVHLTFRAVDPDAGACVSGVDLDGATVTTAPPPCVVPTCGPAPRYGPWDPPAIENHELRGAPVTAVYDTPGTYTITVRAASTTMCGAADLYHSQATQTFEITVHPA